MTVSFFPPGRDRTTARPSRSASRRGRILRSPVLPSATAAASWTAPSPEATSAMAFAISGGGGGGGCRALRRCGGGEPRQQHERQQDVLHHRRGSVTQAFLVYVPFSFTQSHPLSGLVYMLHGSALTDRKSVVCG